MSINHTAPSMRPPSHRGDNDCLATVFDVFERNPARSWLKVPEGVVATTERHLLNWDLSGVESREGGGMDVDDGDVGSEGSSSLDGSSDETSVVSSVLPLMDDPCFGPKVSARPAQFKPILVPRAATWHGQGWTTKGDASPRTVVWHDFSDSEPQAKMRRISSATVMPRLFYQNELSLEAIDDILLGPMTF